MKKYLDRFIWASPGVHQNFLIYPFLLMTIAYGIGMVFFTGSISVSQSILYQLTFAKVGATSASVWGLIALLTGLGSLVGIVVRNERLGFLVTWAGFLLWTYALMLYMLNGFWLQVFFSAIPNMLFWAWWWMRVHTYHYSKEQATPL